jgi:DNA-binding winged helix-turn-helix (wHTH) protein
MSSAPKAQYLSRRQAALLAALLDADGDVVRYCVMGDVVGTNGVDDPEALRAYASRLRRKGVDCFETVPERGFRMTTLPPDWALPDILAMLDVLRAGGYDSPVEWEMAS